VTDIGIEFKVLEDEGRQPVIHAHAVGICKGRGLVQDIEGAPLTLLFRSTKEDIAKDRRNHIEDHTDAEEQEEQAAVRGDRALRQAFHSTHHVAGVELAFR